MNEPRLLKFAIFVTLVWLCLCFAQAESHSLTTENFRLSLDPKCKIISRFDNGWETRMVIESEGQRVRINWGKEEALILFPTSTMRVKTKATKDGSVTTVHLDGVGYAVRRSTREVGWILPGQDVFFRTRGGKVSQVVGSEDYLKILRDTPSRRATLESRAGTTDALINAQGRLESFDGPELLEHIYLVRGLAFQQGPVTLKLPLPADSFLEALPSDRYLTVITELEPLAGPTKLEPATVEPDPLQAEPATWGSPELRAKIVGPQEDPLNVRKENRVRHPVDPLKARTERDSESLLQVKDQ